MAEGKDTCRIGVREWEKLQISGVEKSYLKLSGRDILTGQAGIRACQGDAQDQRGWGCELGAGWEEGQWKRRQYADLFQCRPFSSS